MARERISGRRGGISCAPARAEDCRRYAANAGTAHMAITPMMVTTTTISMRVVPVCRLNTRSPLGVGRGKDGPPACAGGRGGGTAGYAAGEGFLADGLRARVVWTFDDSVVLPST